MFFRRIVPLAVLASLASCVTLRRVWMPPPTTPLQPTLVARAVIPADTFAEGPPSGRWLKSEALHGRKNPFPSQPVQGFSALLANEDGTFLALSDNGYGAIENSADYLLRVYKIRPDFEEGSIKVLEFIQLSDPDGKVPFAIVNHFTRERLLTGADFDLESMQRAPDGTLWFGDEFGPFLLHTDAGGKMLEAPYPLPDFENGGDLRSPQNPFNEEGAVLRVLNALRARGSARGANNPVVSPWHVLIADGDPYTYARDRKDPPQGSGLLPASSELINVALLRAAGFSVVPYTVDEEARVAKLVQLGVSGIISDSPEMLLKFARENTLLTPDGLIDRARFDAQGHRGARALRPENTLPSMEAALDNLVTTLEADLALTADGAIVLGHDYVLEDDKCRRLDGQPYDRTNEVLIRAQLLESLQTQFACDRLHPDFPTQKNDLELSPVAVIYADTMGMAHPYSPPTLDQLFEFVELYAAYYEAGPGKDHPEAALRAKNAGQVRFNLETKVNPRHDFAPFTPDRKAITEEAVEVITRRELGERVDLQSFDWSTLLRAQDLNPRIGTVALMGDFPLLPAPRGRVHGGGNLRGEEGVPTSWLGGLPWPYRVTTLDRPFRVKQSGGFEAMASSPDGQSLWPMLEKTIAGGVEKELLAHRFDLTERRFTGERFRYLLSPRAVAVADFVLTTERRGYVVERDDSQGDLNGHKWVVEIELPQNGERVAKWPRVDLLKLATRVEHPQSMNAGRKPGDVGVGDPFAFPFWTIESIAVLSPTRIAVANDNNFPFSVGRHVGANEPDDNELILIDLPAPPGE